MTNAATQLLGNTEDLAMTSRSSGQEVPEDIPELEARSQLHIPQNSTSGLRMAPQPETARHSSIPDLAGGRQTLEHRLATQSPGHDRHLNARQVAEKLGVSERWVRDHTTRRAPQIRAVKLGSLIRYRWVDVEVFMANIDTSRTSQRPRFGVLSGVNHSFRSTTTIIPDSCLNFVLFFPFLAEMALLLAGPERSPEGAERRACQQQRRPVSASRQLAPLLSGTGSRFFLASSIR
jgi:predicted DNA-binding transcriptional regulator AlpA